MNSPFQQRFGETEPFGGAFRGVRTWGVDSYGRLIGNNHHIWTPGENTAVCKVPQKQDLSDYDVSKYMYHNHSYTYTYTYPSIETSLISKPKKIGCKGVEPHCECGFYAFYDKKEAIDKGCVGVIEGYGLATEGRLGFRSSKAKVLALVLGKVLTTSKPSGGVGMGHPWAIAYDIETTPAHPDQVKRNYPDVKFFETVEDMYSEFPPSDPPLYDPDEEGFWEKPIG